jgi:hypothetical protein
MIVYLLPAFLGLSFILTFFDLTNISQRERKILFLFQCCFVLFIITFRDGIGYDYYSYIDIYEYTPPITAWVTQWGNLFSGRLAFIELGYLVVNGIIKSIFDTYIIVFFAMGTISYYVYYKSFPEMTKYIFSTYLVYIATVFFYKDMGQIRHGVAMALSLYSIQFLLSKNNKKFIIYNTLALLFHKAILPVYILLFLKNFRWKRWSAFGALAISIVLYNVDIGGYLLNYLGNFSIFIDKTESVLNNGTDGLINIERFLFPVCIAFISIIFLDNGTQKFKYYNIELTMLLIGIGIMAVFNGYKEFGQRLSAGLVISEALLLPQICLSVPKDILGKIIGWIVILVLCGIYIFHTLQMFPM